MPSQPVGWSGDNSAEWCVMVKELGVRSNYSSLPTTTNYSYLVWTDFVWGETKCQETCSLWMKLSPSFKSWEKIVVLTRETFLTECNNRNRFSVAVSVIPHSQRVLWCFSHEWRNTRSHTHFFLPLTVVFRVHLCALVFSVHWILSVCACVCVCVCVCVPFKTALVVLERACVAPGIF